jgi:hypothetical protein
MTEETTEAEQKMDVNLATAIGDMEEVRMLTHAIRKYVGLAGVPAELQDAADKLAQDAESLEVQASNYACGVAA